VIAHSSQNVGSIRSVIFTLFVALGCMSAQSPAVAASTSVNANDHVLIPGAVVMPDGTIVDGKAVVVRDGRVVRLVDSTDYDDDDTVLRRPGTVLSPGLIDAYSALGVFGSNVERVQSIDSQLSVVDAIDLWDGAWAEALASGVTAVLLVPGANNLVGGSAALLRTGNASHPPEVLVDHVGILFSFGTPALNPRRAPTSRGGAIAKLRNAMTEARGGGETDRLRSVLDKSMPAIVRADAGEDVSAAIRFFESYGIGPVIVHRDELLEVEEDLVEATVPVIAGPYAMNSPRHVLVAPGRLAAQGIEIAFAGNTPLRDGVSLRLGAALVVRAGMDPAAARRALTVNAARIFGVEERIGSIAPGRDADLVLFTADPLRPDARVLEVYRRGVLVHAAPDLQDEILRLESEDEGETIVEGVEDESE